MTIQLSIALVTRNRSENLKRAIETIKQQSVQPYEIIVSDDSDLEAEIFRNKELCTLHNCKYFKGPQQGLYANRNFVAKNISGTHFRTMDDDHTFPERHLETCLNAILEEPETIWTIGEYLPNQPIEKESHPIAGQLHPRGFSYTPNDLSQYYGISCGATIYPKSVILRQINNIDFFKFGISYLEYGIRLKVSGYTLKPLPSTYIVHHNFQTFANSNTLNTIIEARLYAMISLSFRHYRSIKNISLTTLQIIYELLSLKISVKNIRKVYYYFNVHKS